MPIGTGDVGITQTGTVIVSTGTATAIIETGTAVAIGQPETIASGGTLAIGNWQILSGSLVADGAVTAAPITIG